MKKKHVYKFPKCEMDCHIISSNQISINRICGVHCEWFRKEIGDEEYNKLVEASKELDR